VFLLLFGALVWVGSLSPSYSQCADDNNKATSQQEKKDPQHRIAVFFNCEISVLNTNSGAVTGAATALLVWITYLLVRLGHEQSKTTRAQLRSYVDFERIHFTKDKNNPTSPWTIHIVVKNFGQTPCRLLGAKVEYSIGANRDDTIAFPFSERAEAHPTTRIPPDHFQTIQIQCAEVGLGVEGWQQARREGKLAFVWGRIEYIDVFDAGWYLAFQAYCPFGEITAFGYCAAGNDFGPLKLTA
jgi:hypothetical protein